MTEGLASTWRFHHLGVATRGLARERSGWDLLGYRAEGDPFEDATQGVAGIFLTGPGPRLELLENLPQRSTLDDWLARGIRFYHQAFEVPDLDEARRGLVANRARITVEPVPAVAFQGRHIMFAMLPNLSLIELIGSA